MPTTLAKLCLWLTRIAGDRTECHRLLKVIGRAERAISPAGSNEQEHEALRELVEVLTPPEERDE